MTGGIPLHTDPEKLNASVTKIGDTALTSLSAPDEVPEGDEEMSRSHVHNASYDYARLLAVIGIIWFHAHAPGAQLGYSGLAFFVLLMMVLALPQIAAQRTQRHRAPAILRYAASRGQRLIVPWLMASGFYGGLKMIDVIQGVPFTTEFNKEMWMTGPALHLWFLPFAFAMGLALWPLGRWLRGAPALVWAPLSVAFTALALVALTGMQIRAQPVPIAQWAYALPAVLLGTAFALTRGQPLFMLGLLVVFVTAALTAGLTGGLFQIGVAGTLLILCALFHLPATALSAIAAKASLTIYLIHPAIMTLVLRSGFVPNDSTTLALTVTLVCLGIVAIWETINQGRKPDGLLTS